MEKCGRHRFAGGLSYVWFTAWECTVLAAGLLPVQATFRWKSDMSDRAPATRFERLQAVC